LPCRDRQGKAEAPEGQEALRPPPRPSARATGTARHPQSITWSTEKLIDDRNLDTLKDVLRNTAGITFQAAEGGEKTSGCAASRWRARRHLPGRHARPRPSTTATPSTTTAIEVLRGSASMLLRPRLDRRPP
jgi:catecholate siderophore receptor